MSTRLTERQRCKTDHHMYRREIFKKEDSSFLRPSPAKRTSEDGNHANYDILCATSADIKRASQHLTSNTDNNGGISASTLYTPQFVYSNGTKLFVSDSGNNRVLVWNTPPTSSSQAADAVIGQSNFTSSTAGLSPTSLSYPGGLVVAGGKLYITDSGNSRVLVMPAP